MHEIKTGTAIAEDTLKGLSSNPKFLSSKYFYDERGSRIFQEIMQMPEYYLTDCELEIFEMKKQSITRVFYERNNSFELIELGAGDAFKTKVLLEYFLKNNIDFVYTPVDISVKALRKTELILKEELPELQMNAKSGDYLEMIHKLHETNTFPKIIFFLGSNIGNYTLQESIYFFKRLREQMQPNDYLFIGFDLKKDPQIIINAYNDPYGLTREFNLNLLRRLNRELGANFDLNKFKHKAVYEPRSGTAKSYLVSQEDQEVWLDELKAGFSFNAFESILMEISQKYDPKIISKLATDSGFKIENNYFDSKRYFVNSLWGTL